MSAREMYGLEASEQKTLPTLHTETKEYFSCGTLSCPEGDKVSHSLGPSQYLPKPLPYRLEECQEHHSHMVHIATYPYSQGLLSTPAVEIKVQHPCTTPFRLIHEKIGSVGTISLSDSMQAIRGRCLASGSQDQKNVQPSSSGIQRAMAVEELHGKNEICRKQPQNVHDKKHSVDQFDNVAELDKSQPDCTLICQNQVAIHRMSNCIDTCFLRLHS